jgi:threonylcarbamoyladenosine tRNA methylthiotransferase MtaB
VVPIEVRNQRNKILRNLSFQKLNFFTEQHRGQTRAVLFEQADKNGMMEGYSDNYIKIQAPYQKEKVNSLEMWIL